MKSIEITTWGKWILAGEHAVLRGSPAVVFPLLSRKFNLQFVPSSEPLRIHLGGARGKEFELLFWGVLEKARSLTSISRMDLLGDLHVESSIPVGGGLGASAALCAAVAKLFSHFGRVENERLIDFARELENLFHGESSGVDVAVALSGEPAIFSRYERPKPLQLAWRPHLNLTYSGKRGITAECVQKVKDLIVASPERGRQIDLDMEAAVTMAVRALQTAGAESQKLLLGAIELAQSCFARWELVSSECEEKMRVLREQGALAVKLTGSGDGGYLLSLWQKDPSIDGELIRCF